MFKNNMRILIFLFLLQFLFSLNAMEELAAFEEQHKLLWEQNRFLAGFNVERRDSAEEVLSFNALEQLYALDQQQKEKRKIYEHLWQENCFLAGVNVDRKAYSASKVSELPFPKVKDESSRKRKRLLKDMQFHFQNYDLEETKENPSGFNVRRYGIYSYNSQHETVLCRALCHRCYKVVKPLIEAYVDVNLPSGEDNNTAIMYAARGAPISIVNLLLKYGADAAVTNKNGYTPLSWALWYYSMLKSPDQPAESDHEAKNQRKVIKAISKGKTMALINALEILAKHFAVGELTKIRFSLVNDFKFGQLEDYILNGFGVKNNEERNEQLLA